MSNSPSARDVAERLRLAERSHHVLLCTLCEGGEEAVAALRRRVKAAGLARSVHVSEAHCLGVCEDGPTCIVYPDGTWYHAMDEHTTHRLVDDHLAGGRVLHDKRTLQGPGTRSGTGDA